jgi:F-type H+-transporting ATPase subunit b
MELNATLIGQLITFSLFVWFTMRFVWPPIRQAMQERAQKISEGLEAAKRNHQLLADTQEQIAKQLLEAKQQAIKIRQQANLRAAQIIEEATDQANKKRKQILAKAQADSESQLRAAQKQARAYYLETVIALFEKIAPLYFNNTVQHQLIAQSLKKLEET